MSISVCLATYNGDRFIAQQVQSILDQLGPEDEVIVVDDNSGDNTLEIVRGFCDSRIRVFQNHENLGDVATFARAMELASKAHVFLSDQDDVWIPGRVGAMSAALDAGAAVVSSNFDWINSNGTPMEILVDGVRAVDSERHLGNVIDIFSGRTNYFGCAMAYRRDICDLLLPLPRFVESHDLWVALVGNVIRSNRHLEQSTLKKRKHDRNATSPVSNRGFYLKLRARVIFALSIAVIFWRRTRRVS